MVVVDELAEQRQTSLGLLGAGLAVSAWAGGTIITKSIDMGGLAVGVYRFWFFSAVIVVWMASRGTPMRLSVLRDSALGGIALGLDIAFFFSAIKLTTVVNATLIGSLQPIVVGVVAARFMGEEIKGRDALWSLLALVGVAGVILASSGVEEWSLSGDLLAFAAMFTWSGYFIFSKRSKGKLTSTEYTAGTAIWTAVIVTPLAVGFSQDLGWPGWDDIVWLLVMVALAGVVGHSLMNWSLVRIPLWVGSTFTLLIPVVSAILAWIVLDEALSLAQAAAMGLVLVSLAMIVSGQRSTGGQPSRPAPESTSST